MSKKFFWVLTLLTVFFTLSVGAEENSSVFSPFVSRLQGEIRNNLVRLSWQDSSDVRGPVYIYRSLLPITDNFSSLGLRPVEVAYGVQAFVDEVEYGATYHYFVVASDLTGRRYDLNIGSNNLVSLRVLALDESAPAPVETPVFQPVWSGISSLEALPQGDRVTITFDAENVRRAALYRSVRPIVHIPDLLGAVIIQTRISSPFTDFPVPGIPYYYAVIDEDDLVQGTVTITPGQNSTRYPVEVTMSRGAPGLDAPAQSIRAMPLPELAPIAAIPGAENFNELPPNVALSPQAVRALENIPARPPLDPAARSPRVFARDLEVYTTGGEERALSSIVRGSFSQRDWETAMNELNRFLALPRNTEITSRARFYLGQCLYFLNRPNEGLFEFLAIQDQYPNESREWIQASLNLLRN